MIRKYLQKIYLALIFILLYAPIVTLIILSFNQSKTRAKWGGFTLKWYKELLKNEQIMSAFYTTLIIAFVSAAVATVIGTAAAIARRVGVDEYYSEVLPEDKANFIEKEKAAGRKVIMIGDGINDSPALSAANVGIAISDGAEIAREVADITVGADDLQELVVLKEISNALMKRIRRNYRFIVTFNAGLIACGVAGILQPTTSALLHNTSTLAISLKSMQNLLP